jgi:hypothetical protein
MPALSGTKDWKLARAIAVVDAVLGWQPVARGRPRLMPALQPAPIAAGGIALQGRDAGADRRENGRASVKRRLHALRPGARDHRRSEQNCCDQAAETDKVTAPHAPTHPLGQIIYTSYMALGRISGEEAKKFRGHSEEPTSRV